MADRSMKFTLDFLAKTAGLKNAAELADALGEELDDSVDSGKKLAAAMRFTADRIESDLAETRQMADRLGNALGPEMAAKLGQSRLDEWAVKIRQAGLTADQLDENIDDITASIKRMDAAAESVDGFDQSMKKAGDTTDQTRSVVANFAGNAVQELPGITGAMGPLNMAIGQFAEYASEGNIKMKNLLAAGVGLGALAFVMSKFADNSKIAAEVDAFNVERVKAYEAALKDANSTVGAVRDVLREAERIEIELPIAGMADATQSLINLGLTVDQTAELVAGGESAIKAWEQSMIDAGVPAESLVLITRGLIDESERLALAQKGAAVTAEFLGDDAETLEEAQKRAKRAAEALADALDNVADAAERAYDAQRELEGAALDITEAQLDLADAQARANEVLNDAKASEADKQRALIELRRSQMAYTDAVLAQADAAARLTGAEKGSAVYKAAQLAELEKLKAKFPELTAEIDAYIRALGRIPSNINTTITTSSGVGAGSSGGQSGSKGVVGVVRAEGYSGRGANLNVTVNVSGVVTSTQVGQEIANALQAWWNDGGSASWAAAR